MADSDDHAILICTPIANQPVPHVPARRGKCSLCGCAIWVSRSSPKTTEKLCMPCAMLHLDNDAKFGPLTPKQIADIKRKLG
jgi:hypothetical protein